MSKAYIGFADEHPDLLHAELSYAAAPEPEPEPDTEPELATAEEAPAFVSEPVDRRADFGLVPTTHTASGQSIASSAHGGFVASGGATVSTSQACEQPKPEGRFQRYSRELRPNTAPKAAGAGARPVAAETKGKKVMMRLGVVKSKVSSLQLVLKESASMSSSTATRYMRASDTAREGSLGDCLQLGTPSPRSMYRESLHASLITASGLSASSIVADASQ